MLVYQRVSQYIYIYTVYLYYIYTYISIYLPHNNCFQLRHPQSPEAPAHERLGRTPRVVLVLQRPGGAADGGGATEPGPGTFPGKLGGETWVFHGFYPLVNIQKAIENGHL